jgi:hypothetical protein
LPRAYRRPVTDAEVDRVVQLVEQAREEGAEFSRCVRLGLARVLCSPGFLFIQEPAAEEQPRKLTDYELASRLSYFLWSSMPDEELFDLAKAGRLREPQVLRRRSIACSTIRRPRRSSRGSPDSGFRCASSAASCRPPSIATTTTRIWRSIAAGSLRVFPRSARQDLPVTNFLDSDFVMVNERLARHYGIEGVEGSQIRRVAIEPEHHRGGVLGMAGLMTWLSDGTRTLPVRRAAWVKTQLFGDPPGNPPPNAGEIQPNTAGKNLTVRQRLDLHRNEPTCASCHAKLDPFGIALENYDAIGRCGAPRPMEKAFRGRNAPRTRRQRRLPGGEAFESLEDYKAGLLKRKDQFTRNLVTQFLTYALTRPVGYADHPNRRRHHRGRAAEGLPPSCADSRSCSQRALSNQVRSLMNTNLNL